MVDPGDGVIVGALPKSKITQKAHLSYHFIYVLDGNLFNCSLWLSVDLRLWPALFLFYFFRFLAHSLE